METRTTGTRQDQAAQTAKTRTRQQGRGDRQNVHMHCTCCLALQRGGGLFIFSSFPPLQYGGFSYFLYTCCSFRAILFVVS